MDRYTDSNSASVQYDFVFDDEDRDDVTFTINIEREQVETEQWELHSIEELIDTYYNLDWPNYVGVDWMQDGDTSYVYAQEGSEFGYLFFSERDDLEIDFEFDEDNRILYSTGDFANAVDG